MYWPTTVPVAIVSQQVTVGDSTQTIEVMAREGAVEVDLAAPHVPSHAGGPTVRVPLGSVVGARSGDKGGNANVGVWTPNPDAFPWMVEHLTEERLRSLLPEVASLPIDRFVFPNLSALNFVIHGLLGEGVSSSTRSDPQAKSLGEWLRARLVDAPASLVG